MRARMAGMVDYSPELGRFMVPDQMWEKYMGWSPYQYSMNNFVNAKDGNGKTVFLLGNEKGSGDFGIEDGSNAVFKLTGKGTDLSFKFDGYDATQESKDVVNYSTAIQEAQKLNMNNEALSYNKGTTYCNFGTQNILRTIESTPNGKGAFIPGMANTMNKVLNNSSIYQEVTKEGAIKNAKDGGLSIFSYRNPNPQQSGHIGSFSVGNNIPLGLFSNVGGMPSKLNPSGNKFTNSLGNKTFQYFIFEGTIRND